MKAGTIAEDLARRIRAASTTQKRVALDAGLNETYIRDILEGRSKNPGHERLGKVYAALDRIEKRLSIGREKSVLPHRRFKAARWGWYGDNQPRAADQLGIDVEGLVALESGDQEVPDAVLMRFNEISGIPLWWFAEGRWDGIESELAGRIGAFDPDLIADHRSASDDHPEEVRNENYGASKVKARS